MHWFVSPPFINMSNKNRWIWTVNMVYGISIIQYNVLNLTKLIVEHKCIRLSIYFQRMCAGWRPYLPVKNLTFEQFIDCVLQNPPNVFYEGHTHPLTSLCALCHMDYNIIRKLKLHTIKTYIQLQDIQCPFIYKHWNDNRSYLLFLQLRDNKLLSPC